MKKINSIPFNHDEVLFTGKTYDEQYFSNDFGHFLRIFEYKKNSWGFSERVEKWYNLNDKDWAEANINKFGYEKWA